MDAYEKYDSGELLNGRYSKAADISEGSYGLVSLARDLLRDNAYVAVKYIFPMDYPRKKLLRQLSSATGRATSSPAKLRSNIEDPDSRRKSVMTALLEESTKEITFHKILGHHVNIPDLIDSFGSCLVLEYCSRGDLYEAMQNDIGPTTSQDIKDVFSQILTALSFCHSKSVFHRDLKPENILISDDWTIKICDWGLATTQRIVTNKSEFDVGSERYMAPELFDQDLDSYDASKIDLWSLGVILLTLVFHKNPFQVANYTDKRFLQFSANREALFDFFSTMTAELFGALRFCLNMDPSNRDLEGLTRELDNVRYFTIDEEYWAEHSDEEEDEDVGYDEDMEDEEEVAPKQISDDDQFAFEDDVFSFDKEPERDARQEELSVIHDVSEISEESTPAAVDRHLELQQDDATDSDVTNNTYMLSREHSEMPHNRRADALLSPFTHMKPIPITGNIQIRNTRKPFGVASYTKNANLNSKAWIHGASHAGSHGGKFRREDFFTPRSTFTQYMDKYGELHEQRDFNRNDRNFDKKKKWNRGRKRQSWKKRPQKPQGHITRESASKRRSSTIHKRRSSVRPAVNGTATVQSPTSSINPSVPKNDTNSNTNNKNGGKYVPPFMRSKSPVVEGLSDNLAHLGLHDEEVFLLDDDYNHSNYNQGHLSQSHQNDGTSTGGQDIQSHNQYSGYSHGHNPESRVSMSHRLTHNEWDSKKPNGTQFQESSSFAFFGKIAESQTGSYSRRLLAGRSDSSGKYVPPFRRGSCSAAGGRPDKKRPTQSGGICPNIQQALVDSETSRSVPGEDWFPKREWGT